MQIDNGDIFIMDFITEVNNMQIDNGDIFIMNV